MKHEFHFVLKKELKDVINSFSKKLKKSKSDTVVYIIKIMKPFIDRYYFYENKDERGDYRQFGADTHMHVILDDKSFKMIKHITDNMLIFSMAITLRKIIEIFFKLMGNIGLENVIRKLKKIRYLFLRKMVNIKTIEKRYKNRQLSKSISSDYNYRIYDVGYNRYFDIVRFKFDP